MPVFSELFYGAVVDDEDRARQSGSKSGQPHTSRGRLLGATQQAVVRISQVTDEQVATVVQEQVRLGLEHLLQVRIMLVLVGGPIADDVDALGPKIVDGFGLGAIEVSRRDKVPTAGL